MRETRLSGSEGGGALIGSPYPYLAGIRNDHSALRRRIGLSDEHDRR